LTRHRFPQTLFTTIDVMDLYGADDKTQFGNSGHTIWRMT